MNPKSDSAKAWGAGEKPKRDLRGFLFSHFQEARERDALAGRVSLANLESARDEMIHAASSISGSGQQAIAQLSGLARQLGNNHLQMRDSALDNGNGLLHLLAQRHDYNAISLERQTAILNGWAPVLAHLRPQALWLNIAKRSALHVASWHGNPVMARALISMGADLGAQDSSGDTPLHDAARKGGGAIVQALMEAGANPMAKNKEGLRPYDLAARAGEQETLALLERREIASSLGSYEATPRPRPKGL